MHGLIYISEETQRMDDSTLRDIHIAAAEKNKILGISGYLYYENGSFIQYLEGEEADIQRLMDSIRADSRHKVLYEIVEDISDRKFPAWSMRYIDVESAREINIESILIDQLRLVKRIGEQGDSMKHIVFNTVDNLAGLQQRLTELNQ